MEELACGYLSSTPPFRAKGLRNWFLSNDITEEDIPVTRKLTKWIDNHRGRVAKQVQQHPHAEVLKRTLAEWPETVPAGLSDIFLPNDPPRVFEEKRVSIPFACKGMLNVLTRFADEDIAIAVDMKHKCMAHGWSVLTLSFLVKDKLRNTKIMGRGGRRVQARLLTSHAVPVLQAILNIEKTENIVQTCETLERLWEHVHPDEAKLSSGVEQVHKDYHAALEVARRKCYPQSRPMNDYFHLSEKFGTMQVKLLQEEVINKNTAKVDFDWVKTALAIIRHLPTPDLFSACNGWDRRERLSFKITSAQRAKAFTHAAAVLPMLRKTTTPSSFVWTPTPKS